MTETSIAQINARIAHLRLVYGDADQDAALLEALLKDRVRVNALEDALRQINSITEASFPGAASAVDVAEVQRVARATISASQPAQAITVQVAARLVADAINSDMQAFNRALTSIMATPEMPVQHFFAEAILAYADDLRAITEVRE